MLIWTVKYQHYVLTKIVNTLYVCFRTLQPFFEGLFPRDNPRNTRFAINFFTSIGLGGLT